MRPEPPFRIFVGFDAKEMRACNVAIHSIYRHTARDVVDVRRVSRLTIGTSYARPTSEMPNGQLFDERSGAPMSTDHAIARFFIPWLCDYYGWALFMDGDVLVRDDVRKLFHLADEQYALMAVQHPPLLEDSEKKTGHIQQPYPRKNWSSVLLMHCGHPANRALTLDVLNDWPGRDLHAFRWLNDEEIGSLPARWNYLVGVNSPHSDPALVHYTLGTPDLRGHEEDPFAEEWRDVARGADYKLQEVRHGLR